MRVFFAVSLVSFLAACGTPPKTPDEVRSMVKQDRMFTGHDEFVVNKPFRQVSDNMKKRWTSCLDTMVSVRVPRGNGLYAVENHVYKPNATTKGQHTELTLQMKVTGGGVITVGSPPPDGFYTLVADVDAVNGGTTHVNVQRVGTGLGDVMKVSHEWAQGTSGSCPDLSQ